MDENLNEFKEENTVQSKKRYKTEWFDWIKTIAFAVIIALVINNFIFCIVLVRGASMENTLHDGERLITLRFFWYQPKQGDIIIFNPREDAKDHYVKRVIATEGQTVDIDFTKGEIFVDGKKMNEPYIKEATKTFADVKFPITVGDDEYFVMGDNRNRSMDSRYKNIGHNGLVPRKLILGEAVFRIFPFTKVGVID